jgi:hypothetical protein
MTPESSGSFGGAPTGHRDLDGYAPHAWRLFLRSLSGVGAGLFPVVPGRWPSPSRSVRIPLPRRPVLPGLRFLARSPHACAVYPRRPAFPSRSRPAGRLIRPPRGNHSRFSLLVGSPGREVVGFLARRAFADSGVHAGRLPHRNVSGTLMETRTVFVRRAPDPWFSGSAVGSDATR